MIDDKLPPMNLEAEEIILGGLLFDPHAIDRIQTILDPEAFYIQAHKQIYLAALTLAAKGETVDLMTVTTWLNDNGLLDRVGGTNKLANLVDRTVSAVNIERYVPLVMNKYLRRELINAGLKIAELGFDTSEDLDVVFAHSDRVLFQVSNKQLESKTLPNAIVATQAYQQLETETPIYPTGLEPLDDLIVGFEPGTMTIVAGRPSMGKSHLALFFAMQMILQHDLPVLFFSLEMTAKQLEYRLWSLMSVLPQYEHLRLIPISSDSIRRHRGGQKKLQAEEINTIARIMGIATELPLYLNDNRTINFLGIASECRRLIRNKKKLGLVIVDYIQMMASETGGMRSYELGDVAKELYKMAGQLNVPVLALSQISRAVEGRNNKRPTMADLSQSGILEMVADNVILAYRDEYYNPNTGEPNTIELIVGKARHGVTGSTKFLFNKSYGLLKTI